MLPLVSVAFQSKTKLSFWNKYNTNKKKRKKEEESKLTYMCLQELAQIQIHQSLCVMTTWNNNMEVKRPPSVWSQEEVKPWPRRQILELVVKHEDETLRSPDTSNTQGSSKSGLIHPPLEVVPH